MNTEGKAITAYYNNPSYFIISNCLIDVPDCTSISNSPITCGPNMLYNLDPMFLDIAAGDFRLHPCSPARNAGSNAIVDSLGILTDLAGNPRIQDGAVDMGAYEAPALGVESLLVAQASCGGMASGAVQFQLMNDCAPCTYAWANGASSGTGTTDLLPGTYTFTITDALGKTVEAQVEIPEVPAVTATTAALPYNCATGSSGSASVTITGGTAPFEYLWNDGTTDDTLENLLPSPTGASTYTVTLTDANGCTLVDSVSIGITGSLPLAIDIGIIHCHDSADGTATVTPVGGTAPFAWLWQTGGTTATLDSLVGGSYSATVTDALGCTGDIDFTINAPTPVETTVTATQPACFGQTGTATASATGGTPDYHYLWDNGAATATTTLPPGWHTVTATDDNGCTGTDSVLITAPPLLTAGIAVEPPIFCFGETNGTLAALPAGGTPPYSYDWGGGQADSLLTGVAAGSHALTVTDANGCTKIVVVLINEQPAITVTDTVTPASSPTAPDGSIHLTGVAGGTGSGYQFLWGTGATSQNLDNVPTGTYSLTVTDGGGCTAVFSFFVDFNSVAGEVQGNPFGAAIVPNPSGAAGARVVFDTPQNGLRMRVVDAQGRLIFAEEGHSGTMAPSHRTAALLPKGLAPGSYWIVFDDGDKRAALQWTVVQE
ncbi:MAG: SprB repeat-containing protein [Bacteroidetes bacterium]|nr:SprB repeat-containing protein [Bacteroidota bacterium]